MLEILDKICSGKGKAKDLSELENLAKWTVKGSLCGLGKTAPNPVTSTLLHFRSEYEAHINQKKCPAKNKETLMMDRNKPSETEICVKCGIQNDSDLTWKRSRTAFGERPLLCGNCAKALSKEIKRFVGNWLKSE